MADETIRSGLKIEENLEKIQKFKLPPWEKAEFKEKCLIFGMRIIIYLPVLMVFSMTIGFYLIYMLAYVEPLVEGAQMASVEFWKRGDGNFKVWKGLTCGGLMSLFVGNLVVSMVQVMSTSAGQTSDLSLENCNESKSLESTINPKICKHCSLPKPLRSHHCKSCDKCILKYDHHNFWLASCIGSRNYKYFFLTIFYSFLSSLIFISTFWETLISTLQSRKAWDPQLVLICSSYFFVVFLFIGLVTVLIFHLTVIHKGKTSFEYFSKTHFNLPSAFQSTLDNFRSALGSNLLLWTVPFGYYKSEETELVF
jgi:hypothetical protein